MHTELQVQITNGLKLNKNVYCLYTNHCILLLKIVVHFYPIGATNRLAPPKALDPDASLETVDLNEDDTGLEKFLSDDLLYDVSP